MKCKKVKRKILDYIEGNLNIEEKEEIKNHLVVCKYCQGLYNDFILILNNSKRIEIPKIDENLWKVKLNSIIEKGEISLRSFKPIFISISILILVFSSIFFTKIYLPRSHKVISITKIGEKREFLNHELPLSEDEIIKYADYMEEEEVEKVLDFIFAGL